MDVELSIARLEVPAAHARLARADAIRDGSLRHACSRCRHNAVAKQYKENAGRLAWPVPPCTLECLATDRRRIALPVARRIACGLLSSHYVWLRFAFA